MRPSPVSRARRRWWAALAGLVVFAGVGAAWLLVRSPPPVPEVRLLPERLGYQALVAASDQPSEAARR